MISYDSWKTDPEYDQDVAERWLKRMLGERRKDPDDDRLEREESR